MSALKKIMIVISLAVGLVVGGAGIGSVFGHSTASANSFPTYSTSSRVELVVSPTCLRVHSVTTTYYHWSTAQHRYIAYTSGPRVTTTDQTTCHS